MIFTEAFSIEIKLMDEWLEHRSHDGQGEIIINYVYIM